MSIFNIFRKKKKSANADVNLNQLWDRWIDGKVESPCAELMDYESEVNNGGHGQYFFNIANTADLAEHVEKVLSVLPEPLHSNLKTAYKAFAAQNDIADDVNDHLFEECDRVFWANEHMVIDWLKAYADTLK